MKALRLLPLILLLIISCQKKDALYRKSTILMDTLVTITVSSDSPERAESAIDRAFKEIKRLEGLINFWSPDSEISSINRNAGKSWVRVSPETLELIKLSVFISEKTEGGFDPTIGPVIRLYDFKNKKRPSFKEIEDNLRKVDYRKLKIDEKNSSVFLSSKDMSFDTGGIAKGYAAERAVEILKENGIRAGLVAVAGDIRAFGIRPDGKPWLIGIRNPRGKAELLGTLEITDEAVSTSGDYERFFIESGRRYHHILDPRTGLPAEGLMSVTVVSNNGAWSDGLSTGIFVMGRERALRLAKELGLGLIIVDSDGNLYITDNLKGRFKKDAR